MATLELPVGRRLEVVQDERQATLSLHGADDRVLIRIRLDDRGPVLEIGEGGLRVQVAGDLELAARRLLLHGSERLELRSDGELHSQALAQEHRCSLGDFAVRANDDVKLDGERIRLNCPGGLPAVSIR